jgi:hypothetical protein
METIYSITSDKGDKVYIGRTGQTLVKRKYGHHSDWKNNCCSSRVLFDEYGFENCVFTALEECVQEQGAERERYHIQNTPNVVNIIIPGRTSKEYDESRKEQRKVYGQTRKAYYQAYNQANKERKKAYDQAYYQAKKVATQ